MSKYGLNMTVGEVLSDGKVKALLESYFPGITNHPMIGMAKGMVLRDIVMMSKGKLDDDVVKNFTNDLENLNNF